MITEKKFFIMQSFNYLFMIHNEILSIIFGQSVLY